MIKLRYGYLATGIITGLIILINFITQFPAGNLKIVICDVGQGDAAYVRFPDGHDLLIDGGPGNRIIGCLSRHMPFWDRTIDLVIMTHPQKDHIGGLPDVLSRYKIGTFIQSSAVAAGPADTQDSDIFSRLKRLIAEKKVPQKVVASGEEIDVGDVALSVLWPTAQYAAALQPRSAVLGATTADVNEGSIVLALRYGDFDALFMGDADSTAQTRLSSSGIDPGSEARDGVVEFFKVPHHGAKTAISASFLGRLFPSTTSNLTRKKTCQTGGGPSGCPPVAAISVGKNSYGHPAAELLSQLRSRGLSVRRTDEEGDIVVTSDGRSYAVKN